jgi:hypothetical protein
MSIFYFRDEFFYFGYGINILFSKLYKFNLQCLHACKHPDYLSLLLYYTNSQDNLHLQQQPLGGPPLSIKLPASSSSPARLALAQLPAATARQGGGCDPIQVRSQICTTV